MLLTLLPTVGAILTVSWFGWLYLLAFFPIYFFFGIFVGVAPLVGMVRVADLFSPLEFILTALIQVGWIAALYYLLGLLGITPLYAYFILTGLLNGLLMNGNDLRSERLEFSKNRKPYPWERQK